MDKFIYSKLCDAIGSRNILTDPSECIAYSYDNSRYNALPDAVVFAHSTQEIQTIIQFCNEFKIPIVARGRGTGTTGACVPIQGGIVLALEQMNRILKTDPINRIMFVEPGVTNEAVQIEAAKYGYFWAPYPSSTLTCTIGGNLACNAAGPRSLKYGTCRENTLGLTAVTGKGDIIKTGTITTKSVVGYDLTRLLIGSEGSLAIITEATLKLLPLPENKITLQIFYHDLHQCTEAIIKIMSQSIVPCALEFIDTAALNMIRNHSNFSLPKQATAMLMIEIDGLAEQLSAAANKIRSAATNTGLLAIHQADNPQEAKALWKLRQSLSAIQRQLAPKKINEDIVVPISALTEFIDFVTTLSAHYQLINVNFGHAGNGNIHVNLLIDPYDDKQEKNAAICLDKIFEKVLALNGSLSGEHGVGLDKRKAIANELDPFALDVMWKIKTIFDPNHILNPGKTLPTLAA